MKRQLSAGERKTLLHLRGLERSGASWDNTLTVGNAITKRLLKRKMLRLARSSFHDEGHRAYVIDEYALTHRGRVAAEQLRQRAAYIATVNDPRPAYTILTYLRRLDEARFCTTAQAEHRFASWEARRFIPHCPRCPHHRPIATTYYGTCPTCGRHPISSVL